MNRLIGASLLLATVVAGAGCGRESGRDGSPNEDKAASLAADARKVAEGNNEFALNLYARLRAEPGNQFLSPFSISAALAMTSAGARGKTAADMAKALCFPFQGERLHRAFGTLLRQTRGAGGKLPYEFVIADALWGQQGYPFLPDFLTINREHYGAGLEEVDFQGSPERARQTINAWVEAHTRHRIKNLLTPGTITPRTRVVLTNAVYFRGAWASKFGKQDTQDSWFHGTTAGEAKAALMYQKGTLPYLDGGDFQALALPYAGKKLEMVVLLPREAGGVPALEKKLSAAFLAGVLGRLRREEVRVFLPRFRMTCKYARTLRQALRALGMASAFDEKEADFRGLAKVKGPFSISEVIHKAFVNVDEEGTEAAAATAVAGTVRANVEEAVFRADHPFVFLIRDNGTGGILFLGRYANPES